MPDLPIVLVVEDDALLGATASDALKDGGFDVIVVASGEEALKVLRSNERKCSALATDVNLGDGITGWEMARHAREIDPAIAVVYMTGAAADQWPSQGVPGSTLLQKPFAPAQLITAVSQLLIISSPPAQP